MNFRKLLIPCGFLIVLLTSGCGLPGTKNPTSWIINFELDNKDPYGLYLLKKSLPKLFPSSKVETIKPSYRLTNLGYDIRRNTDNSLLIMVGQSLKFGDGEIDSLFSFVESGHQILLSADRLDPELLRRLSLTTLGHKDSGMVSKQSFSLLDQYNQQKNFISATKDYRSESYFNQADTANSQFYILGKTQFAQPNLLVFSMGEGKLFLQSSPLTFTNYFLLQGNNRTYLDQVCSYISVPISHVYITSFNYRQTDFSSFSVIWNNMATRMAFLITLFALAVYILFEMKRRQKIVPIIKPVENTSVAFTETIGRLYYNKKNHSNLAEKMVQHYLEFVRSHYYINTNNLDPEFTKLLAAKSGRPIAETDSLIQMIKEVQAGIKADETFLYSLYTQIQAFYNGK